MDSAAYLALEQGLAQQLREAWLPVAADLYTDITKACVAGDFDAARLIANGISLDKVSKVSREVIRSTLWGFAVFGAQNATNAKPLLSTATYNGTLNHVTDLTTRSINLNVRDVVITQALQSIASAEAGWALTKKADTATVLEGTAPFVAKGDAMLQLIAGLQSSRMAVWGFATEAKAVGITKYRLSAVLDGRTSKFCNYINGKIFSVEDASRDIEAALSAQNPDDLKTLQPWPDQSRDGMKAVEDMTGKELVAAKYHIPPFHPHCRTVLVRLAKDMPKLPKPLNAPMGEAAPKTTFTVEDFEAVNVKITPKNLDHWNTHVGQSPAQVLAKLSGVQPIDIVNGHLGTRWVPLKFEPDGRVSFRVKTKQQGITSKTQAVFDPASGDVRLNYVELKGKDPKVAGRVLRLQQADALDAAKLMGANTLSVTAAGNQGAFTFSRMGFTPKQADWDNARSSMVKGLEAGGTGSLKESLPKPQYDAVHALLSTSNPAAMQALSDLPLRFKNQQVSKSLFVGVRADMFLSTGVPYA